MAETAIDFLNEHYSNGPGPYPPDKRQPETQVVEEETQPKSKEPIITRKLSDLLPGYEY